MNNFRSGWAILQFSLLVLNELILAFHLLGLYLQLTKALIDCNYTIILRLVQSGTHFIQILYLFKL